MQFQVGFRPAPVSWQTEIPWQPVFMPLSAGNSGTPSRRPQVVAESDRVDTVILVSARDLIREIRAVDEIPLPAGDAGSRTRKIEIAKLPLFVRPALCMRR